MRGLRSPFGRLLSPKGIVLLERMPLSSCSQFSIPHSPKSAFRQYVSRRHWVITILSLIAILSGLFSALAGAYFQIVPNSELITVNLNISGRVRVDYSAVPNLFVPFVSAAGVSAFRLSMLQFVDNCRSYVRISTWPVSGIQLVLIHPTALIYLLQFATTISIHPIFMLTAIISG